MLTDPSVAVIMPADRAEASLSSAVRGVRAPTGASRQASVASDGALDDLTALERAGIGDQRQQRVFWHGIESGRRAALETSLDITANGRADGPEAGPACLLEEPAGVA
jgi:hypothetical protein